MSLDTYRKPTGSLLGTYRKRLCPSLSLCLSNCKRLRNPSSDMKTAFLNGELEDKIYLVDSGPGRSRPPALISGQKS